MSYFSKGFRVVSGKYRNTTKIHNVKNKKSKIILIFDGLYGNSDFVIYKIWFKYLLH
jgi:hypothetical protein